MLLISGSTRSFAYQDSHFGRGFLEFKGAYTQPLDFALQLDSDDRVKLLALVDRSGDSPKKREDFENWLKALPKFDPVFRVLEFYSGPESQTNFNKRNRKNSKAVGSLANLKRQREFYLQNKALLDSLEADYRVNALILVALCSTESRLSQAVLPFEAFAVFCTQILLLKKGFALNPSNSDQRLERLRRLAMHNLVALYRYCSQNSIAVKTVRSSWAGACGPLQFMPFNFHYLADADGDGRVDISTLSDSMAGAARFLQAKGWRNRHWLAFSRREGEFEIQKMLLKYNANEQYARGVLQNAWKLQSLISDKNRSTSPFF
jgi:membrane-bound lytic murein transglycosylase B